MAVAKRHSFTLRHTASGPQGEELVSSHLRVDPFDCGPGNHSPSGLPLPTPVQGTGRIHSMPLFLVTSAAPAQPWCQPYLGTMHG